ncbi:hypothetical protein [Bdellovibrio sp.]|uniref:hypothetical protein n=1 Tax=Bdellovibrio sp. TaxID=28201 RepID=UPI00322155B8
MSVYEAVDRAFRKGGICLDKNDLIFMVVNSLGNLPSLPEDYEQRVEIFLNILSLNAPLFLFGKVGKSLYFRKKENYPNEMRDKIGALWCFTELFYLYRQYLDAEKSESYVGAKDHLKELNDLGVDIELVSGRGRPNQIAHYGLANILKSVFNEFDFQDISVSAKLNLATGRMNDTADRTTKMDARRMALLTASIFSVQFSERIYEVKGEIEISSSFVHPYFHQLMHIKSSLSQS